MSRLVPTMLRVKTAPLFFMSCSRSQGFATVNKVCNRVRLEGNAGGQGGTAKLDLLLARTASTKRHGSNAHLQVLTRAALTIWCARSSCYGKSKARTTSASRAQVGKQGRDGIGAHGMHRGRKPTVRSHHEWSWVIMYGFMATRDRERNVAAAIH